MSNWNIESGTKSQFSERFYKRLQEAYENQNSVSKAVDETMSLFTEEDRKFSEQVKESDWSPTPPVVEQYREDLGNPTTEKIENHEDWKISGRGKTKITRADGSHVQGEILEVTYCGDKDFDQNVVSKVIPSEYEK